jgi:Na+/proline symporter
MTAADMVLAGLVAGIFLGLAVLIIVNPGNHGDRGRANRRTSVGVVGMTLAVVVPVVLTIGATAPNGHEISHDAAHTTGGVR